MEFAAESQLPEVYDRAQVTCQLGNSVSPQPLTRRILPLSRPQCCALTLGLEPRLLASHQERRGGIRKREGQEERDVFRHYSNEARGRVKDEYREVRYSRRSGSFLA